MTHKAKKMETRQSKEKTQNKTKRKKEDGEKRESFRFVSYSHPANRGESNVQIGAAATKTPCNTPTLFLKAFSLQRPSNDDRRAIKQLELLTLLLFPFQPSLALFLSPSHFSLAPLLTFFFISLFSSNSIFCKYTQHSHSHCFLLFI